MAESEPGELRDPDPEGAQQREQIRSELAESAKTMRAMRVDAHRGRAEPPSLERRIRMLGFEGEAMHVFDLLPLVHVCWADGDVDPHERSMIFNLLEIRGVRAGRAVATMEALLERQPSKIYVEESLRVLRDLVAGKPAQAETIVSLCVRVADAAGGFLGLFRRISPRERSMIEHIAGALGAAAMAELNRQLR